MNNPLKSIVFLYMLLAALAVLLVLSFARRAHPLVSAATHSAIDSLQRTRPASTHTIDSLKASADAASALASRATSRARVAEASAKAAGLRADTAAAEAGRRDSAASPWKLAYELRTVERDTLRVALIQRDSAARADSVALRDTRLSLDTSETRRITAEALVDTLNTAVKKAERGCRIAWLIPCPNRKVVAVVAAVAGAAGGIAVSVAKKTPRL